jgi:hypothetical protein
MSSSIIQKTHSSSIKRLYSQHEVEENLSKTQDDHHPASEEKETETPRTDFHNLPIMQGDGTHQPLVNELG